MKKLLAPLALCALFGALVFAQELPPLPDASAAVVQGFSFDARGKGKVVLVNDSYDEDIDFRVFCLSEAGTGWQLLGKASLGDTGDSDSLSLKRVKDKPAFITCFAIVAQNGRTYSFNAEMRKSDLCVHVLQVLPPPPETGACVIDVGKLEGEFEDDIRLVSRMYDEGVIFFVYYWDQAKAAWKTFGKAELKDFKDTDRVDTSLDEEDIETIKIIAVAAQNGKAYSCRAEIDDDDLFVYILPPK